MWVVCKYIYFLHFSHLTKIGGYMNKKIVTILGFCLIPVGAILLNGCAPEELMNQENQDTLALDEASDNWVRYGDFYSEYGRCNSMWDVDGDGLVSSHDPDCHLNAGPLRDLSLYDFPIGHNFFPDLTKIPKGGPGVPGGFRDRAQITRWIRFLTEPDGGVAGIIPFGDGVSPEVVPIPAPLMNKIPSGTMHQGNNNNLSIRGLTNYFGADPAFMPLAPAAEAANAPSSSSQFRVPKLFNKLSIREEYQGGQYLTGSQGPSGWTRNTGNPDNSNENSISPGLR